MSRHRRKPGRIFWATTGLIGAISPPTASARTNAKVQELSDLCDDKDVLNDELRREVAFLGGVRSDENALKVARETDEMIKIVESIRSDASSSEDTVETNLNAIDATLPLRAAPSWAIPDGNVNSKALMN